MYFLTVRGETRIPNFTNSSLAMRSSPHKGLSVAIRRINWRSSSGIDGRPDRDLYRQNRRHPARCQRTTVSGRTTITQDRQSHILESQARLARVAASIRRGFVPRSLNRASCLRSTRFSASIDRRGLVASAKNPARSASRHRTIRAKAITPTSCHVLHLYPGHIATIEFLRRTARSSDFSASCSRL